MTILVDAANWQWRGRMWAHLVSDVSFDELHEFAAKLGIPRRAFQGDHYDIPEDLRAYAVTVGAESIGSKELVARISRAGLRLRKGTRSPH